QAHLLGELGLLDDRAQALLLAGDPARGGIGGDVGDAEDSELHGGVLLGWGVAGTARRSFKTKLDGRGWRGSRGGAGGPGRWRRRGWSRRAVQRGGGERRGGGVARGRSGMKAT